MSCMHFLLEGWDTTPTCSDKNDRLSYGLPRMKCKAYYFQMRPSDFISHSHLPPKTKCIQCLVACGVSDGKCLNFLPFYSGGQTVNSSSLPPTDRTTRQTQRTIKLKSYQVTTLASETFRLVHDFSQKLKLTSNQTKLN